MNANERVQLILELLDGNATSAELAARHGLDEQELLAWRDTWLAGARAAARPRVASRRLLMVGAVMGAALLGLVSREALAATCAAPASFTSLGLNYFCPNDPAIAAEVNNNTAQLVNLMQQKLGTGWGAADAGVATAGITTSSAVVNGASTLTGNVTVGGASNVSFGSTTRQMLNLWGSSYGVGVQNNTLYLRSGGNFAWYVGGVHSNNELDPGGGVEAMRLTVNGALSVRGLKQSDSATLNPNPYELQRLIVESTPATVGVVVPIDVGSLNAMCRDDDGCDYTITMLNFDNTGAVASRSGHLALAEFTGEWRTDSDAQGTDNNSAVSEISAWDCYFGDFNFSTDTNNGRLDTGPGFGLLNVKGGTYRDNTTVCRLIFRD